MCSRPLQISKKESFPTIAHGFCPLTITSKLLISDVCVGSGYRSGGTCQSFPSHYKFVKFDAEKLTMFQVIIKNNKIDRIGASALPLNASLPVA